jgi:hypothetical protein
MSNSEPSPIVLQGIPCMCGLYKFSIRMEKTVGSRHEARMTPAGRRSVYLAPGRIAGKQEVEPPRPCDDFTAEKNAPR